MHISFADLISPYYCCTCGAIGGLLCEYCKYNIISEPYESCILCHKLSLAGQNKCSDCSAPFTYAWCASDRREGVKELINCYKFERTKKAYAPLTELLDAALPQLPNNIKIVPVPTIAPHIRQRGYDQVAVLAKRIAKRRNIAYAPYLRRKSNSVQRGATRKQRIAQADQAFAAKPCDGLFLVIDDITTTGATLRASAQALLDAGANEVWVAVIACQPLEK